MKTMAVWLLITLGAFAALAGGYHVALEQSPRKVLVVVDSSFPMSARWSRVAGLLDRLDDQPYTRFGLITEKSRVRDWATSLRLGQLQPYAPRDLEKLRSGAAFPEIAAADEVVFITNAPDSALSEFSGWTILRP